MTHDTTSQEFFEQKYARDADPWDFATSNYERDRYAAIIAALRRRRYYRAFEPGCSIGVLTEQLAEVCDQVHAMDISPTAVEHAKERCQNLPNVHITCGSLSGILAEGDFDLIVLSEIGYYFNEDELDSLMNSLIVKLQKCGTLLAAHWLGESSDHILSGDRVHESIAALPQLILKHSEQHAGFRLDRWERA